MTSLVTNQNIDQLREKRPKLYGDNCFENYFGQDTSRTLLWESEGIGVFISPKNNKRFVLELYIIDRDSNINTAHLTNRHCLIQKHIASQKKLTKAVLSFEKLGSVLAQMRTAGWRLEVKPGERFADAKQFVFVNPIDNTSYVFRTGWEARKQVQRSRLATASSIYRDVCKIPINPLHCKKLQSGKSKTEAYENALQLCQSTLAVRKEEHEVKMLTARYQEELSSQELVEVVDQVSSEDLAQYSLLEAVERKLATRQV